MNTILRLLARTPFRRVLMWVAYRMPERWRLYRMILDALYPEKPNHD